MGCLDQRAFSGGGGRGSAAASAAPSQACMCAPPKLDAQCLSLTPHTQPTAHPPMLQVKGTSKADAQAAYIALVTTLLA